MKSLNKILKKGNQNEYIQALNNFIANNMEKKELTVRDLIKKLLDFNPDAKVTINLTSVPFPLYSDFSLCWGNDNEGDSCASLEERLESKKTASDVMFDFTSPER